jgi:hypothetical protein
MAVKQSQKQRQNVNVHVNLGDKKYKRKTTRKRITRHSVVPPPIHQVHVSPIHNLMPQMFNRQGQQILTPISPLEQWLTNTVSKPNIPYKVTGRDSGQPNNSLYGSYTPSNNSINSSLISQVKSDFSRNPIHTSVRESDKEFKHAINNQDYINEMSALNNNFDTSIGQSFNSNFQHNTNNTIPLMSSGSPIDSPWQSSLSSSGLSTPYKPNQKRQYDEYF